MAKAKKLKRFKERILLQNLSNEELMDKLSEGERDLYYMIEKITHQRVDDEYYAMKLEMVREAIGKDPEFNSKEHDKQTKDSKVGFK